MRVARRPAMRSRSEARCAAHSPPASRGCAFDASSFFSSSSTTALAHRPGSPSARAVFGGGGVAGVQLEDAFPVTAHALGGVGCAREQLGGPAAQPESPARDRVRWRAPPPGSGAARCCARPRRAARRAHATPRDGPEAGVRRSRSGAPRCAGPRAGRGRAVPAVRGARPPPPARRRRATPRAARAARWCRRSARASSPAAPGRCRGAASGDRAASARSSARRASACRSGSCSSNAAWSSASSARARGSVSYAARSSRSLGQAREIPRREQRRLRPRHGLRGWRAAPARRDRARRRRRHARADPAGAVRGADPGAAPRRGCRPEARGASPTGVRRARRSGWLRQQLLEPGCGGSLAPSQAASRRSASIAPSRSPRLSASRASASRQSARCCGGAASASLRRVLTSSSIRPARSSWPARACSDSKSSGSAARAASRH